MLEKQFSIINGPLAPYQTFKGPLSKYNPFKIGKLLFRHLCFALRYLEVTKMYPVTISYRSLLNNS